MPDFEVKAPKSISAKALPQTSLGEPTGEGCSEGKGREGEKCRGTGEKGRGGERREKGLERTPVCIFKF